MNNSKNIRYALIGLAIFAGLWLLILLAGFAKKTFSKPTGGGGTGGTNADGTPGGYVPTVNVSDLAARLKSATGWSLPCNSNRCQVLKEVSGLSQPDLFALSAAYQAAYANTLYQAFDSMWLTGCACDDPFPEGSQTAYDKLLEKLQRSNF